MILLPELCGSQPVVLIKNLGRIGFNQALNIQNMVAQKIMNSLSARNGDGLDTVLLLEHDPVYTVGIRSSRYTPEDEKKLRSLGADFVRTNRGGLITFHGPGQLVAYPILYLGNFHQRRSIRWYISQLEQCVIGLCSSYGVRAHTTSNTGVWVDEKKIAAIGVHGSRYVTTHGVAINCNTDLSWFEHIVPCGISDKGVTSLSEVLGATITVQDATHTFLEVFKKQFQCQLLHDDLDQFQNLSFVK